jgi:hypothetical protein
MSAVWIAQCLCPDRHCIVASAGVAESAEAAERALVGMLRAAIAGALRIEAINPWCGICNAASETWHYEVKRTPFRTMAEATPALQDMERRQRQTRDVFGDMPRGRPN